MSERLPYEDQLQQHLNDLPLPDENKAWEDMKRRLEEDDDGPIIAWWRRGCLLWGFLLLVIFGSGLWLIRERYFSSGINKKEAVTKQEEVAGNKNKDSVIIQTIPSNTEPGGSQQSAKDETGPLKEITIRQTKENTSNLPSGNGSGIDDPVSILKKEKQKIEIKQRTGIENPVVTGRRGKRNNTLVVKKGNTGSTPVVTGRRRNVTNTSTNQLTANGQPETNKTGQVKTVPNEPVKDIGNDVPLKTGNPPLTDKPDSIVSSPAIKKDSIVSRPPVKKDSLTTNTAKKDSVKKKTPLTFPQVLPCSNYCQ